MDWESDGHGSLFKGEVVDVPQELAELDQWVCWKLVTRRGKTTKVPHRPADGHAGCSVTTRSQWASLDVALAAQERYELDGIGFVFTEDDPYCGVDLDHCVDESGEIHPAAFRMVQEMGSYAEISPSGTGIHCIIKAEVGKGVRTPGTEWGGNFEAYDHGRYFTFTGHALEGFTEIRESSISINLVNPEDDKIIRRMARNASDFNLLFIDDPLEYSDDLSAGDMALANMVAARTLDPEQIERVMRRSSRVRDKWEHPLRDSTWLRETIARAVADSPLNKNRDELDWDVELRRRIFFDDIRDEARRIRYLRDSEPKPLSGTSLGEQLAAPRIEEVYRIADLHPTGGNVLMVAERKSGKSALMLNLLKAVADGTPFLGRFEVEPVVGNIAIFNYEERESHWLRHVEKLGIENVGRVWPQHRRGETTLPFWNKAGQDEIVEWMVAHEISYWIMDPAAVAWAGLVDNENDNALITQFTVALDRVKDRAGIKELVLTHHTGRSGEARGRGAMRLEDWADALWFLERDSKTNIRSMWADGRDVEVERFELEWNDWKFKAGESESEHAKHEQVARDKDLKRTVTEVLLEAGPTGLSKSKLFERCKELEVKISKQRAFEKFESYARSAGVIGMEVDGSTHVFFHKQTRRDVGGSQGSAEDTPPGTGFQE